MTPGDPFLYALTALGVLVALNRFLLPKVALRAWAFWPMVGVDAGAGIYVAGWGFPGAPDSPVVRWMVTALLAMHIAMAFSIRSRAQWDVEREEIERESRRARSRAKE